jgi:hypothetical protein
MHSPQFLQQLGLLVINAGLIETSLKGVIFSLCRDESRLARRLILPRSATSHKLDILRRLVRTEIDEDHREPWIELINDISSLFDFRNQIFHGMPGMGEDNFIVYSIKKGRSGAHDVPTESVIKIEDLEEKNSNLSARHRQLMDFIEDYPLNPKESFLKSPQSQSSYIRLEGNASPNKSKQQD